MRGEERKKFCTYLQRLHVDAADSSMLECQSPVRRGGGTRRAGGKVKEEEVEEESESQKSCRLKQHTGHTQPNLAGRVFLESGVSPR